MALTAAALAVATPAMAQFAGGNVVAFTGRCHSLTAFGQPLSRICEDRVLTVAMPDGRAGFVFLTASHALVSFTAPGSGVGLDRVTYVNGESVETIAATGHCEVDDLSRWQGHVTCEAETSRGAFRADFSSTGKGTSR